MLCRRGSDGYGDGNSDGEGSATTWTQLTSKTSSLSSLSSSFQLEKIYDAFLRDRNYVRDAFNGTYLSGQLICTGYKQEIINGHYLRDVYLIRSPDGIDERMRLYDSPPLTGDIDNAHDDDGVDGKRSPLPYKFLNL